MHFPERSDVSSFDMRLSPISTGLGVFVCANFSAEASGMCVGEVWVGNLASEGRVGVMAPVIERWESGDGEDGSVGLLAGGWQGCVSPWEKISFSLLSSEGDELTV